MGYPRKSLFSLADTPYYHVIARCVRRAWLWGYDSYAHKDYSHRKHWVLRRLNQLGATFAIDLCAYAIMSNHYHLVVHVDRARSLQWSKREVADRWAKLFGRPALVQRWLDGEATGTERSAAEHLIESWRRRLIDVSWYMRCLNEHLARRANAEDGCTGRFWEGRFKSQALLDESGLLTAMAYVDLNPVRAGITSTPEESEFTSIYARIREHASQGSDPTESHADSITPPTLMPFRHGGAETKTTLPMRLVDYLCLVDWTARAVRTGKRGATKHKLPTILTRLKIDPEMWRMTMRPGGNRFGRALGHIEALRSHADKLGQSWLKGLHFAQTLYGNR